MGFENRIFKLFSTNTSIKIMSRVKIDNENYLKVEGKGAVEVETLSGMSHVKKIRAASTGDFSLLCFDLIGSLESPPSI